MFLQTITGGDPLPLYVPLTETLCKQHCIYSYRNPNEAYCTERLHIHILASAANHTFPPNWTYISVHTGVLRGKGKGEV